MIRKRSNGYALPVFVMLLLAASSCSSQTKRTYPPAITHAYTPVKLEWSGPVKKVVWYQQAEPEKDDIRQLLSTTITCDSTGRPLRISGEGNAPFEFIAPQIKHVTLELRYLPSGQLDSFSSTTVSRSIREYQEDRESRYSSKYVYDSRGREDSSYFEHGSVKLLYSSPDQTWPDQTRFYSARPAPHGKLNAVCATSYQSATNRYRYETTYNSGDVRSSLFEQEYDSSGNLILEIHLNGDDAPENESFIKRYNAKNECVFSHYFTGSDTLTTQTGKKQYHTFDYDDHGNWVVRYSRFTPGGPVKGITRRRFEYWD